MSGPITCLLVFQPADPLEETDLSGIVFRLSSLTITKALIRLASLSSAGSDGSLVLLVTQCGESLPFVVWVFFCDGSYRFPESSLALWLELHQKVSNKNLFSNDNPGNFFFNLHKILTWTLVGFVLFWVLIIIAKLTSPHIKFKQTS